jgi:2-dehydropantoate 2-reductase
VVAVSLKKGYFGGRLAHAGEDVTFIARGETLRALRERGLHIDGPDGSIEIPSVRSTDDPAKVGPVDAVLVCVKAWQVPGIAASLQPMVGPDTVVLPLQNGVEAPDQLIAELGPRPVLGGMCRIIAHVVEPGRVAHVGVEPFIALGTLDGRPVKGVDALAAALERAGVGVGRPGDVRVVMWEKFLFIAAVSGLGAVTRAPVGVLREMPETRELVERAMREIQEVGRARGIDLRDDIVARTMRFLDTLPPEERDLMEGRPSELESQNGAVVRLGREAGVATPVNEFVYRCLLPMEKGSGVRP